MGVGRLCAAAAIAIAALLLLLLAPCRPHEAEDRMIAFVVDRPVVTYPEYLTLMRDGEVTVTDGDLTVHLVRGECGWRWLQQLSMLVRAE